MFHTVEKYKTPAQIILGLIALTFIGFGAGQAVPDSGYIVKVGDEKITEHALNNELNNRHAQQGQAAPSRDAVFQELLQRAYLKQGAKLMGIAVSESQIKQIIVDDPSFHDENGKFSQALLSRYLDQRKITEGQFVDDIREQFSLQNMMNLVQSGVLVSDVQAEQLVGLTQAVRTVRTFTFSPQAFAAQVKADDAALKQYYEKNKKDYLIPQAVKLEYIELNTAKLAEQQHVTEEEVQKAAAAKSVDTAAADEQTKAAIIEELRLKKAASVFNDLKEKLEEEAFNHPQSLAQAAQKTKLKVEKSEEWMSRENAAAAGVPDAVVKAAFSDEVLKKKNNSEVITLENGTAWVLRAAEVREQKQAAFEDVKDDVRLAYVNARAQELADKQAKEALATLKSGKAANIDWSEAVSLDAQQARQTMPPEAYSELIAARPANGKPAYVLLSGLPAPVLMEVQSITQPENVQARVPEAKMLLVQQDTINTFDSLLRYLQQKVSRKDGVQQVSQASE